MATAADIAKLETKAVAAEKLIELLRRQISEVREEWVSDTKSQIFIFYFSTIQELFCS